MNSTVSLFSDFSRAPSFQKNKFIFKRESKSTFQTLYPQYIFKIIKSKYHFKYLFMRRHINFYYSLIILTIQIKYTVIDLKPVCAESISPQFDRMELVETVFSTVLLSKVDHVQSIAFACISENTRFLAK